MCTLVDIRQSRSGTSQAAQQRNQHLVVRLVPYGAFKLGSAWIRDWQHELLVPAPPTTRSGSIPCVTSVYFGRCTAELRSPGGVGARIHRLCLEHLRLRLTSHTDADQHRRRWVPSLVRPDALGLDHLDENLRHASHLPGGPKVTLLHRHRSTHNVCSTVGSTVPSTARQRLLNNAVCCPYRLLRLHSFLALLSLRCALAPCVITA